jgi:hypothetical protein
MKHILIVFLAVTVCSAAFAAEGYERYLVPIAAAQHGAYGTFWYTRASAVHEGPEPIAIVGAEWVEIPINPYYNSTPHPLALLHTSHEPPGALLYVPVEFAAQVHILPRLQRWEGLEIVDEIPIPVVGEGAFRDQTRYFGVLTKTAAERIHLRVYSLDLAHPAPHVRVRVQVIVPQKGWDFVYDEVHLLSAEQKFVVYESQVFERRPLALELLLDPILEPFPEGSRVAVSVLPASEGLRIWAMLSETNNTTQHVRVSTPH